MQEQETECEGCRESGVCSLGFQESLSGFRGVSSFKQSGEYSRNFGECY